MAADVPPWLQQTMVDILELWRTERPGAGWGETAGRCETHGCYVWPVAEQQLRRAVCPVCTGALWPVSHVHGGPWYRVPAWMVTPGMEGAPEGCGEAPLPAVVARYGDDDAE